MIYLDTSVVVPLFVNETTSARVLRWRDRWAPHETAQWTISVWTQVEFASAIGMKVRAKALTEKEGNGCLALFDDWLAEHAIRVLSLEPTDYQLAREALGRYRLGLRAGDALHLGILIRSAAGTLVTLDTVLAKSAKVLEIDVVEL